MSILKTIYLQHLNGSNNNVTLESDGDISVSGNVGIGNVSPTYKVDINAGAQGTAANSQVLLQRFYTASAASGGNSNFLEITDTRIAAGSSWNGCGARIQHKVDADYQSYIQFNGNNDYGLSFGSGASTAAPTGVPERMRIDSSGRVTIPYQPAFFAYLGSEQSITTALVKVNFQNTLYSVGNNYDTTNSRFVAPVNGLYQFNIGLYPYPVIRVEMYLFVNGTVKQRFQPAFNTSSGTESNPNGSRASSAFILNANDYVEIYIESADSGGVWNGGPYSSYFNGYLVR